MALLTNWLNGDTWNLVQGKFNSIVNFFNQTGGGTTGQVLTKQSNSDFDYAWETPVSPVGAGGTTGQVLAKQSNTDYDTEWIDLPDFFTEQWTVMSVASGWSGSPEFGVTTIGTVFLRGVIDRTTGGDLIATLPIGYRPSTNKTFTVYDGISGIAMVVVQTNGQIKVFNLDGTSVTADINLHLESISFVTFA